MDDDGLATIALRVDLEAAIRTTHTTQWRRAGDETESYGSQPIVIQGAGAGAAVTARGVFGDVLRLAEGYES